MKYYRARREKTTITKVITRDQNRYTNATKCNTTKVSEGFASYATDETTEKEGTKGRNYISIR